MLTDFERYMLGLAVPCLALPELVNPTDADLAERAHAVGYAIHHYRSGAYLTPRGDGNLTALYKVLGVVPASQAERRAVIGK